MQRHSCWPLLASPARPASPLPRSTPTLPQHCAPYDSPAGSYKVIATGQAVAIHPSSVLCGKKAECIVFNELVSSDGLPERASQATVWMPAWFTGMEKACIEQQARLGAGCLQCEARRCTGEVRCCMAEGQFAVPDMRLCYAPPQVRTSKQYARDAVAIEAAWLPELAPAYFARQHANAGR